MHGLFNPIEREHRSGLPFVLSIITHSALILSAILLGQAVMTTMPTAIPAPVPHRRVYVVTALQRRPTVRQHALAPRVSGTHVPNPEPPTPATNVSTGSFDLPPAPREERATARILTGGFDQITGQRHGSSTGRGTLGPVNTFDSRGVTISDAHVPAMPDEPAELVSVPTPAYTDDARQRRITGNVIVKVKLCANGNVEVLDLIAKLDDGLDHAAIDAVRKLRCRPARRGGMPIDVVGQIKVTFALA